MSKVVEVLELYLDQARQGKIKHIAISAAGENNYSGYAFMGQVAFEPLNLNSITAMQKSLAATVENWVMPEPDPTLDASYACYHLGHNPNGFDFLTWLIAHEMMRIKAGAPGPLKVAFWRGKKPIDFGWLDPVYRPMLGLIGAVEDDRALGRVGEPVFVTKLITDWYKEGAAIPQLAPVGKYNLPSGVITITLREAEHHPHRNSDLSVWTRFARFLQHKGERVVIVRDTAKANEPLEDFETCPLASLNIDARMYLYANAKANFFVSNGPCTMAWYGDKPFVCFTPPEDENSDYEPNTPEFWKTSHGVEVGSQYPWFSDKQRIMWQRADYQSLKKAYQSLSL